MCSCLSCEPRSLYAVDQALDLGRATLAKIRQNLGWALVYNLVGIPLAAGALLPAFDLSLSPAAAGEADGIPASDRSSQIQLSGGAARASPQEAVL